MSAITYPRQNCGCEVPWSYCDIGKQLLARESDLQITVEAARSAHDTARLAGAMAELRNVSDAYNRHVGIPAVDSALEVALERVFAHTTPDYLFVCAEMIRLYGIAGLPLPEALREVKA